MARRAYGCDGPDSFSVSSEEGRATNSISEGKTNFSTASIRAFVQDRAHVAGGPDHLPRIDEPVRRLGGFGRQDHRHSVVDVGHQLVRLGRDDRARVDFLIATMPMFGATGEGKWLAALERDVGRLLRRVFRIRCSNK